MDTLLAGAPGEEYLERSVMLDPMTGRQRWLMFEFVGSNNPAIKLSNLKGPHSARGIEVRARPTDEDRRYFAIRLAMMTVRFSGVYCRRHL